MLTINFAWIGLIVLIGITVFLIHSGFNINLFVKKDEHIADEFFKKFPLVAPEFYSKSTKAQIAENNQEIHEKSIQIYELMKSVEELRKTVNELQWEFEKWKKK